MADDREALISGVVSEAATDALAARAMVESILRRTGERAGFIAAARVSQNSRFRQVVARAVQRVGLEDDVRAMLREWEQNESDEFALAAISDALAPSSGSRAPKMLKDLTDLGRTFRFIADRLRHKVLNAVPRTGLSINRLSSAIKEVDDVKTRGVLDALLTDLRDSVIRLEAAVTIDSDVDAFEPKDVDLVSWLEQFARRYSAQWSSVSAVIAPSEATAHANVMAPTYLLDLVFTNLFDNARQATGDHTTIDVLVADAGREVVVRVIDNGQGFTAASAAAAFSVPVATTGGGRGRGLMEVNDAVRRLGGVPAIVEESGKRCVQLVLPRSSR